MPGDSEEDSSKFASRPGARFPTTLPPASPLPAPTAFAWGASGIRNEVVETGVERDTTGGVTYIAPPLPVVWTEVDATHLRMPWPGSPAAARSLAALRRDLAAHRGPPPEHLLAELDAAARGLAALAQKLEPANWSLGLASPDNLFLHPHGVVPIDLGFVWKGVHPNIPLDASPGRPDWLNDDQPFEKFWPHPPLRQQFAAPGQSSSAGAGGNVAIVGRVLAWLVTGEVREKPSGSGPGQPEPWTVLMDAAGGRIASADDLQARLTHTPIRGCLGPPTPPPVVPLKAPEPKRSRAPLVVAAVVVLALVGVAVWQFTKDDPTVTADTGKQPDPVNKKDEKKDEKKDTKKDEKKETKKDQKTPVPNALAEAITALKAKYDATPPAERAALAATRTELLAKCEAAIVETQTHAETAIKAGDVERKAALAGQLAAVAAALEQLAAAHPAADAATKTKEQECFTFASTLAVQLGARP